MSEQNDMNQPSKETIEKRRAALSPIAAELGHLGFELFRLRDRVIRTAGPDLELSIDELGKIADVEEGLQRLVHATDRLRVQISGVKDATVEAHKEPWQ
jgi:hypothetical protein